MVYVSITGLKLKSIIDAPVFWWHAVRSLGQARSAPGLISAEALQINGIHHTLTVWETEAAMRAYLITGAHLAAMKAFHGIATGRTIGFLTESAPGWDEVHAIWVRRGNAVLPR
jgi:heme-degrading monooxygenase HmoA